MAVVLRYVGSDWEIQERYVCLMLLAKTMMGEEVARQLIFVLSTGLGIGLASSPGPPPCATFKPREK